MFSLYPETSEDVWSRYNDVRQQTLLLCEPLTIEDCQIQSMPQASPTKWHLAHTTWFFEQFVLLDFCAHAYRPQHAEYGALFNSYYTGISPRLARHKRGLLSRPSMAEIIDYRGAVDETISQLLRSHQLPAAALKRIEIGIHHEQQHQELILTDIKHAFSQNPHRPNYHQVHALDVANSPSAPISAPKWLSFKGGIYHIGYDGHRFCFDNEIPQHRVYLEPFQLCDRLVTNEDYGEFVDSGGYKNPKWWLDMGWTFITTANLCAPLYWEKHRNQWHQMTLCGLLPLSSHEPVCHLSYFEAHAYAQWKNARLPTEFEWEVAANKQAIAGNFLEDQQFHPQPVHNLPRNNAITSGPLHQLYGDLWEWTSSSYTPYPGFKSWPESLGEYNAKFMCHQFVLRGGSCATPRAHIRPTYRNYFAPDTRWQFSGIRLARSHQ